MTVLYCLLAALTAAALTLTATQHLVERALGRISRALEEAEPDI